MLYTQYKQASQNSQYRIRNRNDTPTKDIFRSFRAGDNKDYSQHFNSNIKSKNREIKLLLNSNLGFDPKLTKVLDTLKEGMGKFLFGPKGTLTDKLSFFASFTDKNDHELKRDFSKIDIGDLVYLDISDHLKTSQDNRIKEIKKMCFKRSAHFKVNEGNNNINLKKIKTHKAAVNKTTRHTKSFSAFHRPFDYCNQSILYHYMNNYSKSKTHFLSPQTEANNNNNKHTSHNYFKKGYTSKPKSPLLIKRDTSRNYFNLSGTNYNMNTPNTDDKSVYLTQPSRPLSSEKIKEIQTKKKQLEKEINNISTEHQLAEKELFTMLDNERNNLNKFKHAFNLCKSTMSDKIIEDAELIFNVKLKQRDKRTYTKDILKEAKNIKKNEECKKAIIRLSDRITKMNNETALKFADNIIREYIKKIQIKKIDFFSKKKKENPKKVNVDLKLRDKVKENDSVIRRMLFSFNKTKKKLQLSEKIALKEKVKRKIN